MLILFSSRPTDRKRSNLAKILPPTVEEYNIINFFLIIKRCSHNCYLKLLFDGYKSQNETNGKRHTRMHSILYYRLATERKTTNECGTAFFKTNMVLINN